DLIRAQRMPAPQHVHHHRFGFADLHSFTPVISNEITPVIDNVQRWAAVRDYSWRSAAIGSSRAACRAGYTPKARPTKAQNAADSRIGIGAHATCQPAKVAIR